MTAGKAKTSGKNPVLQLDPHAWRQSNPGRVLSNALRRFEDRVIELLCLAGYSTTRAPHVNLTRHLDLDGTRMTELARRARMTNAAMTELIDQCETLGLVERVADLSDRRVRVVMFTPHGREWLTAFGEAVGQAELELVESIGPRAMDKVMGRLQRYGAEVDPIDRHEN
jgi:DNA-binding MarR family transcriptional regulator